MESEKLYERLKALASDFYNYDCKEVKCVDCPFFNKLYIEECVERDICNLLLKIDWEINHEFKNEDEHN